MTPAEPARIHLLPARDAPYVVILRRKPSRRFHVMRLNTKTNRLEHGSWFRGKLYPMRCDVSFDGDWMVYLAMGSNAETWNGVCRAPFLRTVVEGSNMGAWFGGGYWPNRGDLLFSRLGVVYKYALQDLSKGEPGKVFDLEPLEPPAD